MRAAAKDDLLDAVSAYKSTEGKVHELLSGAFLKKDEHQTRGSGYCIESLEAALWCFMHTGSFKDAVLKAVNLGDDADTTGAIVGQLAGAYYGVEEVPSEWLAKLAMREDISSMAKSLFVKATSALPK